MSKWRQRGYVQDSDEEEDESQLESQSESHGLSVNERVERVDDDAKSEGGGESIPDLQESARVATPEESAVKECRQTDAEKDSSHTPKRSISPERPALSPFTPIFSSSLQRQPTESPDPLQSTPPPKLQHKDLPSAFKRPVSSVSLGSSPELVAHRSNDVTLSSQILGEPVCLSRQPPRNSRDISSQVLGEPTLLLRLPARDDGKISKSSQISIEDRARLMFEDSDDEPLSEPPTTVNSPDALPDSITPHRRTAVRVVIPSSTALQKQLEELEPSRQFRQRNLLQLHPYTMEFAKYKQDFQSRDIKPVPRARSPQRRPAHQNVETQEEEYDPSNSRSASPDPEILVSTPKAPSLRKNALSASSVCRVASNQASRRLSDPQLRVPPVTKRRKLNPSLTQIATSTSIFDVDNRPRDVWSIPPNSPPYSSSPPINATRSVPRVGRPVTKVAPFSLPTPSNSSVFHDDHQPLPDSDSEPVPGSVHRSGGGLRQPRRVNSSSDTQSASESEQSDVELRKVGRKIKGVLPASWLRFDLQAQERRKTQALERERARQNAALSPEPVQPQRGVAQKVVRQHGRAPLLPTFSRDVVTISDESDGEHEVFVARINDVKTTVESASALAALFDDRYADDDTSYMEHDSIPLPTLGGTRPKRKRQTKLADAFDKAKRAKLPNGTGGPARRWPTSTVRKRKCITSRALRPTPPPALSIIDVDTLASGQNQDIPLFLKLAKRQAQNQPNLARQSPRDKQIRLHSTRDTQEANVTLQQWRQGKLKPTTSISLQQYSSRQPLSERTDVQHHTQQVVASQFRFQAPEKLPVSSSTIRRVVKRKNLPLGLQIFQRTSSPRQKFSQYKRRTWYPHQQPQQPTRRGPLPFRIAQLESEEDQFSDSHRKIAFEKGLIRADQQFGLQQPNHQPFSNPQLARFLADDDTVLPPLPSATDIGELSKEESVPKPPPKRRLIRKRRAQRIDVDAREYRQPSELAIQDVMSVIRTDLVPETVSEHPQQSVLLGLETFGAQYSITFDIFPLKDGTYFHSSTFIGSDQLRHALATGQHGSRDLDEPAGYCTISYNNISVKCGPWNDETYSRVHDLMKAIWVPLDSQSQSSDPILSAYHDAVAHTTEILRSLVIYLSTHLRFLDPIDRNDFVAKMSPFVQSVLDRVSRAYAVISSQKCDIYSTHDGIQAMTYLLVLSAQIYRVAQNFTVDPHSHLQISNTIKHTSKILVARLVQNGLSKLADFLKDNAKHQARENGIQEGDVLVESVVVCMHVLRDTDLPVSSFWDIVGQELSAKVVKATHVQTFEYAWATIFTLLPFIEVDSSGIPTRSRGDRFRDDNWTCIKDMLKRIFELYPDTYRVHSASLNDYVRASLMRCHRLIDYWHWKRPEKMILAVFDFFAKNGLRPLRRESSHGSADLLDKLATQSSLALEPNESSFHIFIKCLAMSLECMKDLHPERKIQSFVIRLIPNHNRRYPKDQPLDEDSLVALRNHHELLCTLYAKAPPSGRPKLDHFRGLVNHESSHREACRLNVRAWAMLTTFQLSTDEPYSSAKPFALWHKDLMHQTLKQYRLAKTEADDYLKSGVLDGTSDISAVMVRQTMERNQEQVIATLRQCIAGISKAVKHTHDQVSLRNFLIDSEIVHMLELPHLEDPRLISVIRDTLLVLREYAILQNNRTRDEESQPTSDESQSYGDFPDWDDLEHIESQPRERVLEESILSFVETPLWHLLSNAYGAEKSPEDNLLMDCADTWVVVAACQVRSGDKSWSYYVDPYSQVAWQQLRKTEQTRKFGPYFMAALISYVPAAYEEHSLDFFTVLLLSLVERESMLRFQDRLLHAILRTDHGHPLLKNLPFFRNAQTGEWDVTAETLHARRLPLLSSILANMRDDVLTISHEQPTRALEVKQAYAEILRDFMNTMKYNYEQLRQGNTVTGSYIEFVQKIVQFLKQYTNDIIPVPSFFTDSVAFPLPATDPTYVVGRLCGYAPKAKDLGTAKQLSVFVQTVAQQAAADNQQPYLVAQLRTALCTDEAPSADRLALRSVLFQDIFPAYLEGAFSSSTAFLIARAILSILPQAIDTMIFDIRVEQSDNLDGIVRDFLSIAHAFIRGTELLKDNADLFQRSYVLAGLTHMLRAMQSIVPLMNYISSRVISGNDKKLPLVVYVEEFSVYIAQRICGVDPHVIPSFDGDVHSSSSDLLAFCRRGLEEGIRTNWSESNGVVWFAHGNARREVVFDMGTVEEEREALVTGIERFHQMLSSVYMDDSAPGRNESFM